MTKPYYIPGVTAADKTSADNAAGIERLPGRILIFEDSPPVGTVMREAFGAGAGHLPVVNFTATPRVRADVNAGALTDGTLSESLKATRLMAERCAELPNFAGRPDSTGLQILAAAYMRSGRIDAAWAPERPEMVAYPLLTGLAEPRAWLEDLAEAGLLERRFFDRVHECGACGSARMNVREECPSCHSSALAEESLVHHYRCAYQGLEREFFNGERLICPKCRRELRHYGVDYDRPATVFQCHGCGETASDPVVGFLCAECGAHTLSEAAPRRTWYHYALTGEGRAAMWAGRLPVRSLAETMQRAIPGTLSQTHFTLILDQQRRIAARYGRPLAGWRLTIVREDGQEADMEGIFRLVAEIVAQEVRDCDSVTAGEADVKVLMPETDQPAAEIAIARVRSRLAETISGAVTVAVESGDRETLADLLR